MIDLRRDAEEFAERLGTTLGPRARSVLLYGSVARGEAIPGISDVNVLVLVDAVDPDLLRDLAPEARRWLDIEHALPLVLSWEEWRAASDAFAIEVADMLDARVVLDGSDPLVGVTVDRRDVRLQSERELRSKLLRLRGGMLATADRPGELGRLLLSGLPSIATYLRAALRLDGRAVPDRTPETLAAGCALLGVAPDGLLRLWELRAERRLPEPDVRDPLVASVHDVLERTVAYVDAIPGEAVS